MAKIIIISLFFMLSGCQTAGNFKKNMDTWVGADAQALVDQWGYPPSTIKAPNGNDVYIYNNNGNYYVPPTTTYNTTANVYGNTTYATTNAYTSGGYNISLSCTVFFEINDNKKVEKITWKGNNCVA